MRSPWRFAARGAGRRGIVVVCLILTTAGGNRGGVAAPDAAAPSSPPRSTFDPRRPPEKELQIGVDDGFTLAAVGDCIISRPHAPMLAHDTAFASVIRIVRDADAAFGNFEDSAIDLSAFK